MRRKVIGICLISIVVLAFLLLSCVEPPPEEDCTIDVKATLGGSAWTGSVEYTLTGPAGASPINGTSVESRHTVDCGSWTCAYVSGGPAGASFTGISPADTQTVSAGGTITFTLNFVTEQETRWDVSIEFETWTIDGQPVPDGTYRVSPGTIIDIEYEVHASGEEDAVVEVYETKWLRYHYKGPGEGNWIHAVNAPGGVTMHPPADKIPGSQMTSVEGQDAPYCTEIWAPKCQIILLDVHVGWEQVVCVNYKQDVNWLRINPPYVPSTMILQDGLDEVLFDIYPAQQEQPPLETITLSAMACVEMEGDENPDNDCTDWCPELTIEILPPELPD